MKFKSAEWFKARNRERRLRVRQYLAKKPPSPKEVITAALRLWFS